MAITTTSGDSGNRGAIIILAVIVIAAVGDTVTETTKEVTQ